MSSLTQSWHTRAAERALSSSFRCCTYAVGGVGPLWENMLPTCLEFSPNSCSAVLRERLLCFPGMSTAWRVMLLSLCICIWLPAQVSGALVVSRRDAQTEVHKIRCLIWGCLSTLCAMWVIANRFVHKDRICKSLYVSLEDFGVYFDLGGPT